MENLFWIPLESKGRLAIATRPRPDDWLQDEIRYLKRSGIDILVSALTPEESEELGLENEMSCCVPEDIEFVAFPITDRSVPDDPLALSNLAKRLEQAIKQGTNVAIHCRASIGRSSLLAASVLGQFGISANEAFVRIASARGCSVPDTPEQRAWFENHVKPSY